MTHHTDAARAEFEAWRVAEIRKDLPKADVTDGHIRHVFMQWSATQKRYLARDAQIGWEAWKAARRAPAAHSTWKDHDTAKLVNDLRECAVQYHAAGQLRERIAHLVRPLAARLACAPAAPVPLRKPTVDQVSAEIGYHASAWDCVDPRELIDAILMLAAAPQPPEAAPVELPEPAGVVVATIGSYASVNAAPFVRKGEKLYTEQQVRDLLAAHGIGGPT